MRDSNNRRDIREEILDATDKLLARYGYKKMTIDDLAREVGIGKGSIYLHFDSKEEIALSHIDRIVERLKFRLEKIATSERTPAEKIREMLAERVLYRFDSVQHYSQSLNELLAKIRSKLIERRSRHFDAEARLFSAVVKEGVANGSFGKCDAESTAFGLLNATNSLLPYSLSAGELGKRDEIEKKVRTIARLLLDGMCV